MLVKVFQSRTAGYVAAILGVAIVTVICALLRSHINDMTVALAMLLVVLFVASVWERCPAVVASVLGVLCLNYFFLPPIYSFTIADPKNWVALAAFLITALTTGGLSALARKRTAAAEAGRKQARLASAYNRSLIEASLDPLVTIGRDGKITDVNAATVAITGRSRTELIGTDFWDYFVQTGKAREGYQTVFREGLVRDYSLEVRHRDGHTIPVLYNASVYRDEAGEIVGVFAAARDITERRRAESEIRLLARLQEVLAQLGQQALRSESPHKVLDQAVVLVAKTLHVEYCKVLELLPDGKALLLRSGVGWKEGLVGHATVGSGTDSQAGFTLLSDQPVMVEDLRTEKRFSGPPLLHQHKVVSGMSVIIPTSEGPYGVLGAHTKQRRTFTKDEVNFLQAVANVLGTMIERRRAEDEIRMLAVQQAAVAELGQQALRSDPFGKVLDEAVVRAAQILGIDYARVLELQPDGKTLLLRAGAGWKEGVVGHATVSSGTETQAGFTLISKEPVILEDLCTEKRFQSVPMFGDPDVISGMSAIISTSAGPYGVFSVHTRQRRTFTKDEVSFLQSIANVLGIMVERRRAEEALLRSNRAHRALSSCNQALVRATDESTLLQQICRLIVQEAGYRFCWVGYPEQDETKARQAAGPGGLRGRLFEDAGHHVGGYRARSRTDRHLHPHPRNHGKQKHRDRSHDDPLARRGAETRLRFHCFNPSDLRHRCFRSHRNLCRRAGCIRP